MYEYDIDTTPTRRSFRIEGQVFSIVLEACWWDTFDAVCPRGETRKTWILEWIQDARDKDCNRQALIRYRIHQLVMQESQDQGQDPDRSSWSALTDCGRNVCLGYESQAYFPRRSCCRQGIGPEMM